MALVLLGLWLGIELGPGADAARAELAQLLQPSPSPAPPKPMPPRPRLPRPELRRSSVGADIAAVRADTLFAAFRAHLAAGRLAEARTALE